MVWTYLFGDVQTAEKAYESIQKQEIRDHFDAALPYDRCQESMTVLMLNTLFNFSRDRMTQGLAVHFGATRPANVVQLLKKGWKVVAVNGSAAESDRLKEFVERFGSNWIDESQITFVSSTLDKYEFPRNVRLICFNDELCYSNPKHFQDIWLKAHDALEKNGRVSGDFLWHCKQLETFYRERANAWSVSWWAPKALLQERGYQIEIYQSQSGFQSPFYVQFLAKK